MLSVVVSGVGNGHKNYLRKNVILFILFELNFFHNFQLEFEFFPAKCFFHFKVAAIFVSKFPLFYKINFPAIFLNLKFSAIF